MKKNFEPFRGKPLKIQILITSEKIVLYQNDKIRVLLFLLRNNMFHGRSNLPLEVALIVYIDFDLVAVIHLELRLVTLEEFFYLFLFKSEKN